MSLDRLSHVIGTRGVKSAGRGQQRRNKSLVAGQQEYRRLAHSAYLLGCILLHAPPEDLLDIFEQVRKRCLQNQAARIKHNPPAAPASWKPQANRFPHPPFDPIASHGVSNRPGNRESDPEFITFVAGKTECGEVRSRHPDTILIHFEEVPPSQQTVVPWEREPWKECGLLTAAWRNGLLFRHSRSACGGPWPGGGTKRHGRLWFSFAHGSREFSPAYDCSAEKYVLASQISAPGTQAEPWRLTQLGY